MSNREKIRDRDIRNILLKKLQKKSARNSVIVQEFGLHQGDARIDVAVINGSINGYEIKSEADYLDRLPSQATYYNRVFDKITVVTSQCHLKGIKRMVPRWWGISVVHQTCARLDIENFRAPKENRSVDPGALVQLLWRDEALAILKTMGIQAGIVSSPRHVLWGRLIECIGIEDLRSEVIKKIKNRLHWRSDTQLSSNDDSSQPLPTSFYYQK